jgi:hypothetical protein
MVEPRHVHWIATYVAGNTPPPPLFSRPVRYGRNRYDTAPKRLRPYRTTFLERETPYDTTDEVSGPYRACTAGFPRILKGN